MQFAAQPFGDAYAEDESHSVGGQPEQSLTLGRRPWQTLSPDKRSMPSRPWPAGPLENAVNGEVTFEDKVPAILRLVDRVVPFEIHGLAIFLRELRTQQPSPVVQSLLNDGRAQFVRSRDQWRRPVPNLSRIR